VVTPKPTPHQLLYHRDKYNIRKMENSRSYLCSEA
jgi:hypothetical protein